MTASPTSPFLAERLIARLSPQRRANLMRNVRNHVVDALQGCDARGNIVGDGPTEHHPRTQRLLGRLAAWI